MNPHAIHVAVDVGSAQHRVAVGLPDGKLLDEFDIAHHANGFREFFRRIEALARRHKLPVAVAMEGYNGWARPLDGQIPPRLALVQRQQPETRALQGNLPSTGQDRRHRCAPDFGTVPPIRACARSQECPARSRTHADGQRPAQAFNAAA